jgi:hypothetical protein
MLCRVEKAPPLTAACLLGGAEGVKADFLPR